MKLNRIGSKLGLASMAAIVLSGGMVANQILSDFTIRQANEYAEAQQQIAVHSLKAHIDLRRMQLSLRDIQLSRTVEQVRTLMSAFNDSRAAADKELDSARSFATEAQVRERLTAAKELDDEYAAVGGDLAATQETILGIVQKRNAAAADWSKILGSMMASASVREAGNRLEIERALFEIDSSFNSLSVAAWRLAGTGDERQKQIIVSRNAALAEFITRLRGISGDKSFLDTCDRLSVVAKSFSDLSNDVIRTETAKAVLEKRSLPIGSRAEDAMTANVEAAQAGAENAKQIAGAELMQENRIGLFLAVLVVLSLTGSILFSFLGIAWPLTRLNHALARLAGGDTDIVVPGARRGDEIGDIAKTVTVIRLNAEQKARDELETRTRLDRDTAEQRKADIIKLADAFEGAVGEIIDTVSSASTELEASATTLTATAERAQEVTTLVAAASGEASSNVQSVAAATEEMASSVNEISRQVQESARIANDAVLQAQKTNDRIDQLARAASRIGDVVELIKGIAGQTNLLALNATIEASRAGEVGRGFAVVASEVKALAEQTASATGEIGSQISGMQAATQDSVRAIKEIGGTIEQMSQIASIIATAVEMQGAATHEISRNVQDAARGTQQVTSNIANVQRGAAETGSASSQVLTAAQLLAQESSRLKREVVKFLGTVRAS